MPLPVIIITHEFFPYPGGVAVYVREVALALAAEGREVSVWCPPDKTKVLDAAARGWPFRVVPIPGNGGKQGWRDRIATLRLWRARAPEIQASHVLLAEPGAVRAACYAPFARLAAPARLSVMLHGSEIRYLTGVLPFPHRRFLLERLLARAERVGVVSGYCRELLLSRARVSPEKIRIAPGALRSDLVALAVPPAVAPPVAAEEAPFRILCVARIHPRKGQLELLQAVAALPDALRVRVRVRFVGRRVRADYGDTLAAFAQRHGICHEFAEAKDAPALAAFYADADLFALTSLNHARSFESFGLVYIEAGAFGLPVLAHNTGGVADAVRDGETGLLAPEDNPAALALALRRLIEDPPLRHRLAVAGSHHARTFSWPKSATQLL